MIDIKRAVRNNQVVTFQYFREGTFYYTTEHGELFGVPLDDIDGATLQRTEKAIMLMRWMRKWNEKNGAVSQAV